MIAETIRSLPGEPIASQGHRPRKTNVGATLASAPKPVVHWEATLNDDFRLSDEGSILPGQDSITVTAAGEGHPLAANLQASNNKLNIIV